MTELLSDLIVLAAARAPEAPALRYRDERINYGELNHRVQEAAQAFVSLGAERADRIAVYLEKRPETVISLFAASSAGAAFVPINPLLRPQQIRHILTDCNARILVTSPGRLAALKDVLGQCPDLRHIVMVDGVSDGVPQGVAGLDWADLPTGSGAMPYRVIDGDMAAIIYTSGSTGLPKGVVLSHRNLVAGARSVSTYLDNTSDDRILLVLPLSFDAGLSQLTTSFHVGAEVVLMNFLLPRDVANMAGKYRITGIAGVPPLWHQLAGLDWPADAKASMRYFSNTGGHMPKTTLDRLRAALPDASPYLMYGLTEAFRSTYLPPSEIDHRPDSMGKAIPNAEILVVDGNGQPCPPGQPGELVHRGALVALGYWNDPERTSERFKPAPGQNPALPITEMAVWSGDTVRQDEDGFFYFVGRTDDMIKTSGYRVSPTEIEEVVSATGLVNEVIAVGVPDEALGQAIVVVATPPAGGAIDAEQVIGRCRESLPHFMVPHHVVTRSSLPRNPNGKIDRLRVAKELQLDRQEVS
jgi:acyl-CoA ligase (AMP-forming) (exosortase A-associated)